MGTHGNRTSDPTKPTTTVQQTSDRELVVTRTIDAPLRRVFDAWTTAEMFRQWWVPKSYGLNLLACDLDVRVGGRYRLAFSHEGSTLEFFGTYLEVTPDSRLVWTNEEGEEGETITTVTFREVDGTTVLTVSDLYPSTEALESGSTGALPETLDQLEAFLNSPEANTTG